MAKYANTLTTLGAIMAAITSPKLAAPAGGNSKYTYSGGGSLSGASSRGTHLGGWLNGPAQPSATTAASGGSHDLVGVIANSLGIQLPVYGSVENGYALGTSGSNTIKALRKALRAKGLSAKNLHWAQAAYAKGSSTAAGIVNVKAFVAGRLSLIAKAMNGGYAFPTPIDIG